MLAFLRTSLRNTRWAKLSSCGVMGMNRRNISYISKYNPRASFPIVDNKLLTKKLAIQNGVNTPELIGVVENQNSIKTLSAMVAGVSGFCMKPARGSGGKGIMALVHDNEGRFLRTSGDALALGDLERHTSNILAGLFSLGGAPDVALLEGLIKADEAFKDYSYEGVPDIRIIVFRGIPVMAMIRLSCHASSGKANLHQGAVGVGLDMASGRGVNAVQRDQQILQHPDTGKNLLEIQVPQWDELLALACKCFEMSGLGYLGVDLVLDQFQGPTLLELNARPGLSIQIANNAGILPRLRKVESLARPERMSIAQRIQFSRENFSA